MLTIAVDVDETVADLLGEWLRRYNERSGDSLLPDDVTSWHVTAQVRPEWKDAFYEILMEPDLYRHVLPIQGARKAVQRLVDAGHHVIFASSCPAGTEVHKIAWLTRYGFIDTPKKFVSAKDKSLVRADILIDDGPHNVESFVGKCYLVDQPHNATYPGIPSGVTRVRNIGQAADIILAKNFRLWEAA